MAFTIQTNVNSLIALDNLRVNGDFQSRTIQRLTSGYWSPVPVVRGISSWSGRPVRGGG